MSLKLKDLEEQNEKLKSVLQSTQCDFKDMLKEIDKLKSQVVEKDK